MGFAECIRMAQNGNEWPPVPITFISMCKLAGLDVEGSYARFASREKPKDLAEKTTRSQVGFNVKAMAMDKALRKWSDCYKINYQKMLDGTLKSTGETPALMAHSSVTDIDIERDNFSPSTTKSAKLVDRLNKIRDRKK